MHFSRASSLACAVTFAVTAAALPSINQKHPVSEELFKTFKRFTDFTSASAYHPCYTPPDGALQIAYINNTESATQASIFRDDTRKQFILAMPGSATRQDYITDAEFRQVPYVSPGVDCKGCYVHHGFLDAWNSIAPEVQSIFKKEMAEYSDYRIWVAGHSLGAAIAQFAYASLIGLKFPVAAGYTMGQPRVGDPAFADYIDSLSGASHKHAGHYHRITHAADIVPQIPKRSPFWRHPGTEYWESGINHTEASTTYRCLGQDPLDCSDAFANVRLADKDDDHMFYSNVYMYEPSSCGE